MPPRFDLPPPDNGQEPENEDSLLDGNAVALPLEFSFEDQVALIASAMQDDSDNVKQFPKNASIHSDAVSAIGKVVWWSADDVFDGEKLLSSVKRAEYVCIVVDTLGRFSDDKDVVHFACDCLQFSRRKERDCFPRGHQVPMDDSGRGYLKETTELLQYLEDSESKVTIATNTKSSD